MTRSVLSRTKFFRFASSRARSSFPSRARNVREVSASINTRIASVSTFAALGGRLEDRSGVETDEGTSRISTPEAYELTRRPRRTCSEYACARSLAEPFRPLPGVPGTDAVLPSGPASPGRPGAASSRPRALSFRCAAASSSVFFLSAARCRSLTPSSSRMRLCWASDCLRRPAISLVCCVCAATWRSSRSRSRRLSCSWSPFIRSKSDSSSLTFAVDLVASFSSRRASPAVRSVLSRWSCVWTTRTFCSYSSRIRRFSSSPLATLPSMLSSSTLSRSISLSLADFSSSSAFIRDSYLCVNDLASCSFLSRSAMSSSLLTMLHSSSRSCRSNERFSAWY